MDRISHLIKIEPYRKEARQLAVWAIFAGLLSIAMFALGAYVGIGDVGWKLLVFGIASSFWSILLSGRILEREQTADILEAIDELNQRRDFP